MPIPRELGAALGRSGNVIATGILNEAERNRARRPSRVQRTDSADGNTVTLAALVTPGSGMAAEGAPMVIPSGTWIARISVLGDYDDIFAGATGLGETSWGAWLAHRPSGTAPAAGSGLIGEISGPRTVTPTAMVDGTVAGAVTVSLILTRGGTG